MKAKQLRTFLEEFLISQGATTERRGEHLLAVHSPRRLVSSIGSKELVLAFSLRGLQEDPRSELVTVGNPVFDRILELARQSGMAGERFEPAPPRRKKVPEPEDHFDFGGQAKVGPAVETYTPLYYGLYRIEYSLEDVADELEPVPVDGVSLLTLPQTPELGETWSRMETKPARGRSPQPAYPVPVPVLRTSLRLLEKRLRKRLSKIRRASEEHLVRESESIERYYRQLIEETRNASRRWSTSAENREERIRVLQQDWKRRIDEAQVYWRPQLDVKLVAVAAAQRPRIGFPVAGGSATERKSRSRAHKPSMVYWDETDNKWVEPPCLHCGGQEQREIRPVPGGFLCPRCWKIEQDGRSRSAETARQGAAGAPD